MHLLRGLSVGLGINYSCAEQWRPIAEEALYRAGRLKGGLLLIPNVESQEANSLREKESYAFVL